MKKGSNGKQCLTRPLRINRETLRQLDARDLNRVVAAFSGTSICTDTTGHCCQTL